MNSSKLTVADRIAEWLHEKRITHAFGVVGGGNVELWDAITRLGKTQIVCQHHEQACVMSASAFYRISGRISVALVTTGAGSTNAITGVASAYMDSIPVLILSGNEASKYMGADTRVWGVQGYDSAAVALPFTKRAFRLDKALKIAPILDNLLLFAMTPRQGPVWIDIPKDVQSAAV